MNRLNLLEKISHGIYEDDDDLLFDTEELEPESMFSDGLDSGVKPAAQPEKTMKESPLKAFTRDLTEEAEEGLLQAFIGREGLLNRISEVLCRKLKNNPILVGDPGTGKTALAEGLALKIVSDACPSFLRDYKILSLDMGSVVAGTRFQRGF